VNIELDRQFAEPHAMAQAASMRQRLVGWWQHRVARLEYLIARLIAWTATRMWQVTVDWRSVRPFISRVSAHLSILLLAVSAIVLSSLNLPKSGPLSLSAGSAPTNTASQPVVGAAGSLTKLASIAPKTSQVTSSASPATDAATPRLNDNTTIVRIAQPRTEIPIRPRLGVITYTVQAGDTVQSIAEAFSLQPTTLMWSNSDIEDVPDLLRIGQHLVILPVDGVYHTVAQDDTLESIAEKYKVDVEAITGLSYNNLHPPIYRIQEGMKLIVPGGTKPYVPKRVTSYSGPVPEGARGTGAFQWPVLGTLTQGYWWGHRAIDIGAPTGSAVLASDGGYVGFVGWTDIGYGNLIIVDHANGYSSYYAHLSQMYVTLGQRVERGQVIGAVGSTGWSSGPHLHLEIRYNGVPQNPLVWLP
jgi:murein DD-endopeptidase MepM/ murein hydrolase activator NlpD